jgi:hypothetical protein
MTADVMKIYPTMTALLIICDNNRTAEVQMQFTKKIKSNQT